MKSAEEIMEILEAFDLTQSYRDAGELAGVSHHTVARYVRARDAGALSDRARARARLIDEYLPKIEEWVEHSRGKVRADVANDKLDAMRSEPPKPIATSLPWATTPRTDRKRTRLHCSHLDNA